MNNVSLILIHLLVVVAKLLGPGGIKGIIAESTFAKYLGAILFAEHR